MFDARSGQQRVQAEEWMYAPRSIQFTPDERFCVTGTTRKRATLWELSRGVAVRHFGPHADRPLTLVDVIGQLVGVSRKVFHPGP